MTSKLVVIAAVGDWKNQRYIGESNQMPWKLPRDLRFFKTVTEGSAIIMGRKTFESLGKRALPKRRNIVITRQNDYLAPKCDIAHSLEEALAIAKEFDFVFVIGGGQLYSQALPLADHLLITQIRHRSSNMPLFAVFRGDTYFPEISPDTWRCIKVSRWFKATNASANATLRDRTPSLYFKLMRFDRRRVDESPSDKPPKLFFGRGRLIARRKQVQVDTANGAQDAKSLPEQLPLR